MLQAHEEFLSTLVSRSLLDERSLEMRNQLRYKNNSNLSLSSPSLFPALSLAINLSNDKVGILLHHDITPWVLTIILCRTIYDRILEFQSIQDELYQDTIAEVGNSKRVSTRNETLVGGNKCKGENKRSKQSVLHAYFHSESKMVLL